MKKKILVVDDEPDITTSIKNGLTRNGFEVTTFNDPTDALANYVVNTYDLLLLDIRMAKMNGFELYRELKKKGSDTAKACFFTAFEVYYDEFKKIFPNLEVKCFIRKPITITELISHINTELGIN
jgi:two-component system catabolic regulation response regulator CreB/two-component system response regulator ChvI